MSAQAAAAVTVRSGRAAVMRVFFHGARIVASVVPAGFVVRSGTVVGIGNAVAAAWLLLFAFFLLAAALPGRRFANHWRAKGIRHAGHPIHFGVVEGIRRSMLMSTTLVTIATFRSPTIVPTGLVGLRWSCRFFSPFLLVGGRRRWIKGGQTSRLTAIPHTILGGVWVCHWRLFGAGLRVVFPFIVRILEQPTPTGNIVVAVRDGVVVLLLLMRCVVVVFVHGHIRQSPR